jgi:hypothetical protein
MLSCSSRVLSKVIQSSIIKLMMNKIISISILVVAIVLLYSFVIRPIQRDKKLEECLYGAGVTLAPEDTYERYEQACIQKYGNK